MGSTVKVRTVFHTNNRGIVPNTIVAVMSAVNGMQYVVLRAARGWSSIHYRTGSTLTISGLIAKILEEVSVPRQRLSSPSYVRLLNPAFSSDASIGAVQHRNDLWSVLRGSYHGQAGTARRNGASHSSTTFRQV